MRFVIHGAGALGSLIGGRLAASGAEVVLIGRDPHMAAIVRHGLRLHLAGEQRVIRHLTALTSLATLSPRPDDILFIAVKSAATAGAVQELREKYYETIPIFCLQNGVRNEELAARRFLHVHGVMAGLVARLIAPGIVAQLAYDDLAVGAYPRGSSEVEAPVVEALRAAGFRVTTPGSIMTVKWAKLLLNLNNATLAILDCHLQLAMVTPSIAGFMAEVIDEALHVLDAAGIAVDDPQSPYQLVAAVAEMRTVPDQPEAIGQAQRIPAEERAYPSTWTDLHERRGQTEAGFLNGEIILLGEKYGLPTPFNSTLLDVVEGMARERILPGHYTLTALRDLVEKRRASFTPVNGS